MDRTAFEAGLREDGFDEIFEASLPPGHRSDTHSHAWEVRGLILEGEFRLECGGADAAYHAGQIFTLVRDTPHTEGAGPEGATYVVGRKRN
jgi:quercetin dioxygenase-like cupin family protein